MNEQAPRIVLARRELRNVKIAIPKNAKTRQRLSAEPYFTGNGEAIAKKHCSAIDLSHKFGRKSVFGKARQEFLKKILWQATSKDVLVLLKLTFASSLPSCWIALAKKLIHVPSPTSCNKTIKLYESKQFFSSIFLRFFHGRNFFFFFKVLESEKITTNGLCKWMLWRDLRVCSQSKLVIMNECS